MRKNKTIWTNGCFDIIHAGHIELFKYAKSQGDTLFVGIDSDERVSSLKGESRPINSQTDRKSVLESIRYIDKVFVFGSAEEMEKILLDKSIDLIVIGDEYKGRPITGESLCDVAFFEKIPGLSTTSIIESIKDI